MYFLSKIAILDQKRRRLLSDEPVATAPRPPVGSNFYVAGASARRLSTDSATPSRRPLATVFISPGLAQDKASAADYFA